MQPQLLSVNRSHDRMLCVPPTAFAYCETDARAAHHGKVPWQSASVKKQTEPALIGTCWTCTRRSKLNTVTCQFTAYLCSMFLPLQYG